MFPSARSLNVASNRQKEVEMLAISPLAPRSFTRELVKSVSSGWWVLLVSGIVSIVAGGIVLIVDWTVGDLAVFLGVLFILRGIFTMFSQPIDGSVRGWAVALGLLEAGVGIAVLVWPDPTLLVVAALIGWWVLFSGVMTTVGSISARRILPYWGLFLALGIVEAVAGVWLLQQPGLTLVATVLAIGLWSVIYGIVLTTASFELRLLPTRLEELEQQLNTTPVPDSRPRPARAG
jgi:uncharacterized membrane protein HdeD (DUF308 family)